MSPLPAPFVDGNALIPRDVNATSHPLQVICAWPVSGQYGSGSRILYYALIVACVVAHGHQVIRDAVTSAALLLPALAAIHGITLAALHRDGGVDMDIYGAFQICSIGILTCTLMARRSETYFNAPGGQTIVYFWTGLVLAGLLSLAVEFYRIETTSCTHDESVGAISNNPRLFPFNDNPNPTFCGILCNQNAPPFSPMRAQAQNNIYVIPAPSVFTFGQAMLFSAACCIPAILSLAAFSYQIKEFHWRNNNEKKTDARADTTIKKADTTTGRLMKRVDVPVFSVVILAILIIGEINFWSIQVSWQTEPIGSVGQWSPIVGTILIIAGSAYIWWAGKSGNRGTSDEDSLAILPTEDSSPDEAEALNLAPKIERGIDWEDDRKFTEGNARKIYFKTPAEELNNPDFRNDADRYEGFRNPSRDSSPYPQNRPRTNSTVDRAVARCLTSPISPPTAQPLRRASLGVPQAVYPGRGRRPYLVSTSPQPEDEIAICVEPE